MSRLKCTASCVDVVQNGEDADRRAAPLVHFPSPEQPVRTLKTSEAAAVLNVSPNTLRAWERRFGYPKPQRSPGKHRLYTHGEVAALRDALQDGLSISSAVSRAREALSADTSSLAGALGSYELDRADAAMEAALALRSVERSVEEVLLPSLSEIGERHGFDSAPWAFSAQWASDWLVRAQRLAPPPLRPSAILVGDATRDEFDFDALSLRSLQLFRVRSGIRVPVLPVSGVAGLSDVINAFGPQVVVIAGADAPTSASRAGPTAALGRRTAADGALPPQRPDAHGLPPPGRVARRRPPRAAAPPRRPRGPARRRRGARRGDAPFA